MTQPTKHEVLVWCPVFTCDWKYLARDYIQSEASDRAIEAEHQHWLDYHSPDRQEEA